MRVFQYPDEMGSKFKFIAIASQRCRQLQKGAKPRVTSRSKKFTTVAQEEVLAGTVAFTDGPQIPVLDLTDVAPSPEGGPQE